MTDATITTTDNGPYLVRGSVTLIDPDGDTHASDRPIALCSCGLSAIKPFCDGSHTESRTLSG
jgi:CDGSH-type Zn-finger protein